jgi:hypothetical protein
LTETLSAIIERHGIQDTAGFKKVVNLYAASVMFLGMGLSLALALIAIEISGILDHLGPIRLGYLIPVALCYCTYLYLDRKAKAVA